MNIRAIFEGHFTLPLPVASAVPLFTPEGEQRWAGSSWDPMYAIPEAAADDSAPGTVFTTESDGGAATWIVLERREDGMSYARVARPHSGHDQRQLFARRIARSRDFSP